MTENGKEMVISMPEEQLESYDDSESINEASSYNKKKAENIILIGMTASGKTTVGSLLAQYIGFGFLDLDAWIEEAAGEGIPQIFIKQGEKAFREIEKRSLSEISSVHNHVISVGSGITENSQNWQKLKSLGTIVWLDCSLKVIASRLCHDEEQLKNRPLMSDALSAEDKTQRYQMVLSRLEALFSNRKEQFQQADLVIGHSFSTPEDSARRIKGLLENRNSFRN